MRCRCEWDRYCAPIMFTCAPKVRSRTGCESWIMPALATVTSGNRRQKAGAGVERLKRLNDARILIYSHDSFGLGHLRRCRAIAHALVDRFKGVSVLILSGSPIIGSFDFRSRVDFVRIPGVIKLSDGEYQSLGLHIALDQTMEMRAAIIRQTALSFRPDLFLVDKEPLGLKGEVVPTLQMLKAQGTTLVLGLRDIMDEPKLLLRSGSASRCSPRWSMSTTKYGSMASRISRTRSRASPVRWRCARSSSTRDT